MKHRPRFSIYVATYLLGLLLFFILFPLRLFDLQELVLFYPAQGETQANKNFFRILFVIPPILVLISLVVSTTLSWKVKDRLWSSALALLAILACGAGVAVLIRTVDGDNVVKLMVPVFLVYTLASYVLASLANLIMRKIRNQ